MEKFIAVFEEWRSRNNLGQVAAAERIGISQSSYWHFIREGKAGKIVKRELLRYLQEHKEEFASGSGD